jgi:hypothetical protein
LRFDIIDKHLVAIPGEPGGDGPPDSPGGAGDDDGFGHGNPSFKEFIWLRLILYYYKVLRLSSNLPTLKLEKNKVQFTKKIYLIEGKILLTAKTLIVTLHYNIVTLRYNFKR